MLEDVKDGYVIPAEAKKKLAEIILLLNQLVKTIKETVIFISDCLLTEDEIQQNGKEIKDR